jgi:hypothetical protein
VFPDAELIDVERPAATGTMAEAVSGYGVTSPLPDPQAEGRELREDDASPAGDPVHAAREPAP